MQMIELGETFTVVADDNGKMYTYGANDYNQLGRQHVSPLLMER